MNTHKVLVDAIAACGVDVTVDDDRDVHVGITAPGVLRDYATDTTNYVTHGAGGAYAVWLWRLSLADAAELLRALGAFVGEIPTVAGVLVESFPQGATLTTEKLTFLLSAQLTSVLVRALRKAV